MDVFVSILAQCYYAIGKIGSKLTDSGGDFFDSSTYQINQIACSRK